MVSSKAKRSKRGEEQHRHGNCTRDDKARTNAPGLPSAWQGLWMNVFT
jgi:hypothetical protein